MECETCSSPLLFQVSSLGFRQFGVGDKPWTLSSGGDGALSDRGMIILELSQSSVVKFISLSNTDQSSYVLLKLRGADAVREGLGVYGF